ncbi:energy-coupling factor transporter transmembrane protein EcfT [Corynebacterium urealyticum]|uniref:energy-coupling factor transporter transmembrane component T family protein n=1 Tax=Corynebacterium urealyticum TaxID=43771 RepID=UPI00293E09C0|nr:energy-coupling factor transporter transmembrane protein EcfT [Corynebacterium urealyticum]WOH95259.1 energy-coupling factor transporter transmembrane protein EcfT [Corynebacterium urealyticum]
MHAVRLPRINTAAPVLYIPTGSVIHRLPAGAKLTGLIAFLVLAAIFAKTLVAGAGCVAAAVVAYALAKIPWRTALRQLTPILIILLAFGALTWWRSGLNEALVRFLVLWASVSVAILLTMTTKVSDLQRAVERALAPAATIGLPVDKISLAISLTIHMIPLQLRTINEVVEAQQARGGKFSARALGIPLVIRTLLRGREVGEALQARGVGD